MGKGVFYWYFDSKEMLFEEILRDAQKDLRRRQQRAVSDLPDPIERMEQGIRAAVHWSFEHRDLAKLVDFAQTDERFAHLIRHGRSRLVGDAMPLIKEAMVEGLIPEGDPEQHSLASKRRCTSGTQSHRYRSRPSAVANRRERRDNRAGRERRADRMGDQPVGVEEQRTE